jgi:catechol 2,3-dioxygenase-like lactoylglutathione lyase family enzyme
MTEMASLVLYAASPAATAAFYRALGLGLEDEDHGQGPGIHPLADQLTSVNAAQETAEITHWLGWGSVHETFGFVPT